MAASRTERSLAAKVAVHQSWANTEDRSRRTAPARAASPASIEYFERQLDPDGTMPADERRQRAEHLRSAHFARLAAKSAKAAKARRQATEEQARSRRRRTS